MNPKNFSTVLHSQFNYQTLPVTPFKFDRGKGTVKPLITNTSKEFIKCRILHFLIMECCRYLVFEK